ELESLGVVSLVSLTRFTATALHNQDSGQPGFECTQEPAIEAKIAHRCVERPRETRRIGSLLSPCFPVNRTPIRSSSTPPTAPCLPLRLFGLSGQQTAEGASDALVTRRRLARCARGGRLERVRAHPAHRATG